MNVGQRLLAGYRALPETSRMALTAVLGALTGLVSYEIIYWLNPLEPRATTSWVVSFLLGVTRQHGLHRWLTFNHRVPYWPSLGRAYVLYSGSLLWGTGLSYREARSRRPAQGAPSPAEQTSASSEGGSRRERRGFMGKLDSCGRSSPHGVAHRRARASGRNLPSFKTAIAPPLAHSGRRPSRKTI